MARILEAIGKRVTIVNGMATPPNLAFIDPEQGTSVTEQELRTFVRKSLAGFKVPKRVIIREDLPRGPTGKILKRRLFDLL